MQYNGRGGLSTRDWNVHSHPACLLSLLRSRNPFCSPFLLNTGFLCFSVPWEKLATGCSSQMEQVQPPGKSLCVSPSLSSKFQKGDFSPGRISSSPEVNHLCVACRNMAFGSPTLVMVWMVNV